MRSLARSYAAMVCFIIYGKKGNLDKKRHDEPTDLRGGRIKIRCLKPSLLSFVLAGSGRKRGSYSRL